LSQVACHTSVNRLVTASAAGATGFISLFLAAKNEFRFVYKFGEHVANSYCEGDKDEYFL